MSLGTSSAVVQHLVLYFRHGIRDVIPYSDFIEGIRPVIETANLGEYLSCDMSIDGGDAETVFACSDARELYRFLLPKLSKLSFLRGGKVTLFFGPIDPNSVFEEHGI